MAKQVIYGSGPNTASRTNAVLALIQYRDQEFCRVVMQEPYVNWREIGWALSHGNLKVAFSEARGSDQLVVYFGQMRDFMLQGNTPVDEVYKGGRYYSVNDIYGAARHIIGYLTGVEGDDL